MTDAKGTLARFDPATNAVVAEIYVASGSFGLAFGEDAVWVTSTEHSTRRARRSAHQSRRRDYSGRQGAAVHRGRRRRGVDAEPGRRQRLAHRSEDQQGRRDDRGRRSRPRRRDRGRRRIGVGDGVRVPALAHRSVDQHRRAAVRRRRAATRCASASGSVWLSNLEAGNVWRLDPRRVEATLPD